MKKRLDMTNIDENSTGFPVPIPDLYTVQIVSVIEKKTKKGDDMIEVKLQICNDDSEFNNAYIWDNIVFSPAIMGRTKHFLHCIGEPYKGEIEIDSDHWMHSKTDIELVNEEYQGKIRAKVGKYILNENLNKMPF
jgi:hypothetical protein